LYGGNKSLYSSYSQLPNGGGGPPPPPTSKNRSNPLSSQNGNGFPMEGRVYEFDHVFDEAASQEKVYQNTTAPLVKSVFDGFCATVFAYGATSSGKTHTMVGTQSDPGIMKRSIDDIFLICSDPERETKAEVCSLFIYILEKIFILNFCRCTCPTWKYIMRKSATC
jgi:hypothetical protein